MAAVSDLVRHLAEMTRERETSVNALARALLDHGLLPKSSGRAIAQVTPRDVTRLVIAVAVSPRVKDAAETVLSYENLTLSGAYHPPGMPEHLKRKRPLPYFGDAFEGYYRRLCEGDIQIDRGQIEFVTTWREVFASFPSYEESDADAFSERFVEPGQSAMFWQGYTKRVSVISGRLLTFLAIRLHHMRDADATDHHG